MYKHLQKLMLIVALFVPWVMQAQDCTPISTFPVTYGFESSEGFTTTVTAATACTTNVFNSCWRNEQTTFHGSTGSGRIWHIYGGTTTAQIHSGAHSLILPDKGSTTEGVSTTMLTFPAMSFTNPAGYVVSFWIYRNGTGTSTPEGFKVYASPTDTIGPNAVELGHYSRHRSMAYPDIVSTQGWYQYETSPITMTGTVYLIFEGQSYYGSSTYIDDVVIMESPSCIKVNNLAVDQSQTTSSSLTLTWIDTNNSGASYNIYNLAGNDTILLQSGVSNNSYTVTGLDPGTLYTLAVVTDCGNGDTSMFSSAVSAYTDCEDITANDLPYTENFESYSSGSANSISPCWTKGTNGTTAYPYPYSTAGINSSIGLYFYGYYPSTASSTRVYSWAALPRLDDNLDVSSLMLSFKVKRGSTASNYYTTLLYVGVAETLTGFSSATAIENAVTWIDTIDHFSDNASSIHSEEIFFDNYSGTGKYIVIYCPVPSLVGSATYAYNYAYVDDVALRISPTCFWPTAANIDAITSSDADISWTPDPRTSNPSSWTIEYDEHGFTLGEGNTQTAYSTTTTLTGLNANTQYDVYIRANCGSEESDPIMISFRTSCEAATTLPITENFDGMAGSTSTTPTASFLPYCWDYYNHGTRTNYQYCPYVYSSTTYSHSGSNCIRFYSYASSGDSNQYLIFPDIDSSSYPINSLQIGLWLRAYSTSASYHANVVVGVMTNIYDETSFVPCTTFTSSSTSYAYYQHAFGNYNGNHGRIALKFPVPTASSNYEYGYIDDITIEEMPSCPPVLTHNVTNTAGAARISWSYNEAFPTTPDAFEVSYGYAADSLVGATTLTTTETSILLTGLDPDTNYMVMIHTDCSSDYGPAYTFSFSTRALPCVEYDTTSGGASSPEATYVVGTPGTSTTNVMPVNGGYNYSYCNHLILASDVSMPTGTTHISGIDFQYAGASPMTAKNNCAIYMCHTTMTICDNFANPADLVLVYEGPLNCVNGWNHFEFNRNTFAYNGTSNMIVAIVDNSGATDANESFYYENVGTSRSHRVYRNDAPYTFAELGTVTAGNSVWRTNMRLTTGGNGGGECLTQASCMAPDVTVIQNNDGDIEVSWIPGYQESDWDLDYRTAGSSSWTNELTGTSNMSYSFQMSSLQPNTLYEFRVTSNCSDTNLSTIVSFTTPCSFISIPYSYGFEDMATGSSSAHPNIPCWHHLNNGTSYGGYPYVSSTTPHTGSRNLYWYGTTTTGTYGDYQVVVLPPVDVNTTPLNTLQLTFWARPTSTSYAPVFLVGTMSDPTDISTFHYYDSVIVDHNTTDWNAYEVVFNNYSGTDRYIAVRANRPSSTWYAYTDDFTVENAPSCPRITGVHASNVSQTDATIAWSSSDAYEYELVYGPSGFAMSTGSVESNLIGDSIILTGLQPNTAYDVYVRGICTDDTGNWSFVYTFRTSCGLIATLPFVEDFENQATGSSSTGSAFIPCWTRLNNGTSYGGYPYLSSTSSYNHTQGGTKGLYWSGSTTTGTYGDYYYIILPEVDTNVYPMNSLQLSFWAKSSSTSYYPVFQVGIMDNNTDTNFTLISTINVGNNTEWTEFVTTTSDYTGNGSFIAIRGLRPSSTWYAYMDDITLDIVPPCPRVVEITAPYVALDTITVAWNDTSSSNTMWYVEYDTVEFIPGTGVVVPNQVTDTFYVIDGLDSATQYHIYVYPACGDYVGYRHIAVSTLAASPATVPYMCDFEEEGPNGWDLLNDGQTNYWMVGTSTNNGGTQSMYITNDGTNNAYTITTISYSYAIRTFHLSEAGEYAYSYDWKGQGESHNYDFSRIFVVPASEMFTAGTILGGTTYAFASAVAPDSWIELTQSGATPNTLSQSSSWQTVTGTFNITTPGNYKMVIAWANDGSGGTNPPTAIDNVSLVRNICPAVENLTVQYVTIDSAFFAWNGFDDHTSYIVEYDTVPFTPGTAANIDNVTDTFYSLNGLSLGTTYYVVVRGDCNGDIALGASMNFTTLASLPATAPYSCDFEQQGTNGWDIINGTQNNYWIVGSATNNGGSRSLYITDDGTTNSYSGAASYVFAYRTFNLQAGNYICSFDWKCNGESSYDFIRAALVPASANLVAGDYSGFDNTSGMPAGSIALDGGNRMNLQTSWATQVTEFNLPAAGSYKLVFMWRNDPSVYNVPPAAIDNVELNSNTCPIPQNITLNNLTQTSTDISWVELGNATTWEYQFGNNAPVVVTDTFCTVAGLSANTNYTFKVRSICGQGDTSMWMIYDFRTPCGYLSLPYIQDFEAEATGTSSTGSTFVNCWTRLNNGTTYGGYPYVSSTSTYNHTTGGTKGVYWYNSITATTYGDYQCMVLPPVDPAVGVDSLQFSFWTKASSASYTPVFQIGVMTDPNNISTFVGVDTVTITTGTTWINIEVPLVSYTGTGKYVAIKADRPASSWYAYVDDIILEYVPNCLIPQNVTSTGATMTSITLDWVDLNQPMEWEIRYSPYGSNNTTSVLTSNHPYTIAGLDTLTSYVFEVRAICGYGDTSRWSLPATFGTEMCDNAIAAFTGTPTSTSYYAPVNNFYKYTLTETIIDSAELAGIGDITAVAYNYNYSTASTEKNNVTIYLKPTTKSVFSSSSDMETLDSTALQVYTGHLNCLQGWNYFLLDTTYTWDGHSNLMVIVDDNSNDYNSSSYVFNSTSCSGYKTLVWYSDSYNPDPTSSSFSGTKTYYQYRPTMKLVSCGGGCSSPNILSTTNMTYHSATVNWSGSANSYEIAVKAANAPTWPAETAVNGNSYDIDGLTPATTYQFRVRAICDAAEGLISDWSVGTFTTDSLPCMIPGDVELVAATVNSATIRWTSNGNENSWRIHVWNTAFDQTYDVTSNPFTVTGLSQTVTYNATVSALCGGIAESDPSDTIVFTTATCQPATNVTVTNVTALTAVVNWNGTANSYNIEYGPLGFGAGDGTTVSGITNTTYTITDLEPEMQYDVYVYANCDGQLSVASGVVHFTTMTGIAGVDGSNISIYPNPATSATVVSLTGINGDVTLTIVDMNGRTVLTETMGCEGDCTKRIEIDGLAQGAYFVRISGEGINAVKKLVVK